MTARPRRKLVCPITASLDIIGAKWTIQILRELSSAPVRTNQLLRAIPGLSMKTLQERLKVLQDAGIVSRTEFKEKLLHVEYSITERGRRLFLALLELKKIGEEIHQVQCSCPMAGLNSFEADCPSR